MTVPGLPSGGSGKVEKMLQKFGGDNKIVDTPQEQMALANELRANAGEYSKGEITGLKAYVQKESKVGDFLFNVFGENSDLAKTTATTVFSGINDMIDLYNRTAGVKYTPDLLSTFPKPEDYLPDKEKLNKNDRAQAYAEWRAAVSDWKASIKDGLEAHKEMSLKSLSNQIDAGFKQTWVNQGLTMAFVESVCDELKGDINAINQRLSEAVKEIKNTVQAEGAKTRDVVVRESEFTASTILADGAQTRQTVIDQNKATQKQINELQKEIMDKLEKMPTKKSLVIDLIKGSVRLPIDTAIAIGDLGVYLLDLPLNILKKISEML